MVIFDFIVARLDKLIFRETFVNGKEENSHSLHLLLGIASALQNLAAGMGPQSSRHFTSFSTGEYKVHIFESETGFKFLLFTSPDQRDLREELRVIYRDCFVPFVLLNPLHDRQQPVHPITCCAFVEKIKIVLSSMS